MDVDLSPIALRSKRLYPSGQSRYFTGGCIFVDYTTRNTALQFWLGHAQSFAGGSDVARSNRNFNFFHKRSDTANPRTINQRAICITGDAFFRRFMICHQFCPKSVYVSPITTAYIRFLGCRSSLLASDFDNFAMERGSALPFKRHNF